MPWKPGAQNGAEHYRFAAGFVGMLAREGEHLWVGGRTKAAEEDADEQQNEVVPVPCKQHAGQHSQQAADDNQLLAVALTVRTSGEELTDQNAYDGAAGKKKPTIAGRTCTSLVRNRLRVGVCNAPAMPVRKATIRKAEEVTSNTRRGRAALRFSMCLVFCSFRRRRGVYACWLKINSSMARIIKKAFQNTRFSKS